MHVIFTKFPKKSNYFWKVSKRFQWLSNTTEDSQRSPAMIFEGCKAPNLGTILQTISWQDYQGKVSWHLRLSLRIQMRHLVPFTGLLWLNFNSIFSINGQWISKTLNYCEFCMWNCPAVWLSSTFSIQRHVTHNWSELAGMPYFVFT